MYSGLVFRVHENSIPWLDKRFSEMAKDSKELGEEPVTYEILSRYNQFITIRVIGGRSALNGMSFVIDFLNGIRKNNLREAL